MTKLRRRPKRGAKPIRRQLIANELSVNETAVRAWQRILEIEHDAGIDPYKYEVPPKRAQDVSSPFVEIGAGGAGASFDGARSSLLLRRPDGGVLTVKGNLTEGQIMALVLKPEVKKGFVATSTGSARMTWARLLARVFAIDIARCGGCGAKIYPEQCEIVTDAPLVAAILHALGLDIDPPVRGPPRRACGDGDVDQRSPYRLALDPDAPGPECTDDDMDQRQPYLD